MSIHSTTLSKDEVIHSARPQLPDLGYIKYASIPTWCRISGMGRTLTYEYLAQKKLKAIKLGRKTLIDVPQGISFLNSLPAPKITTGLSKHRQRRPGESRAGSAKAAQRAAEIRNTGTVLIASEGVDDLFAGDGGTP